MCLKMPVKSQRCLCQPMTATSYLLGMTIVRASSSVSGYLAHGRSSSVSYKVSYKDRFQVRTGQAGLAKQA